MFFVIIQDQLIITFNSTSPFAPKPTKKKGISYNLRRKVYFNWSRFCIIHARESIINYFLFLVEVDEIEQESPSQSSNPIGVRTKS